MYRKVKRAADFSAALLGLVVLSPFFLIIALAIKLSSKGPVFFRQERLGLKGKTFKIYKFRSMVVNAESTGTGVYSFKNDPRVTKVGKFLRATSLDEVPQLINILTGEMSFIGPRPTLTYHPWSLEEYTQEQGKRFHIRPGVTGWAQIHGRKEVQWDKRIEYDVWYVENVSFLIDLKIFFRTIIHVLAMKDNVNVGLTVSVSQEEEAFKENFKEIPGEDEIQNVVV